MTADEVREIEARESRARARSWCAPLVWTALFLLLGAGALYGPAAWRGLRLTWMRWQFEKKWNRITVNADFADAPVVEPLALLNAVSDSNLIRLGRHKWGERPVTLKQEAMTLKEFTDEIMRQSGLEYRVRYPNTLILYRPDSRDLERFDSGGLRWGRGSADVQRAFEKEVALEFEEQPIDECIQYLQGFHRMNWKAMWGENYDPKTPVTLRLSRLPLADVWDCMLRVSGLVGEVRDGRLIIRPIDPLPEQ